MSTGAFGSAPRRRRIGRVRRPLVLRELRDAGAQLRHGEGFGEMARGAMAEALVDLLALDRRGHEHDRDVGEIRPRANRVRQRKADHIGHRHVGEDYVRTDPLYEGETVGAIRRDVHVVGGRTKRRLHQLPDHRIVFAKYDRGHDAASVTSADNGAPRGRVTWNTDPSPTVLSTQT